METVVIRYGEIGTKTGPVRTKMVQTLRQRIEDRLEHENKDYQKVSDKFSRIIIKTQQPKEIAQLISETPGISSTSPAIETENNLEKLKQSSKHLDIGESFAVTTNRSGKHSFDSRDVNRELGSFIEQYFDAEVDLDNPDTLVEVDVQPETAYIFTERFEGPDGYPVGVQGNLAALISGGIDSPVAAYEIMTRGANIVPIYFYNKPYSAEDHLIRFKSVVKKLKRFNPEKNWQAYIVDMEGVNKDLSNFGSGRMVLHRRIMYKVAEKIVEEKDLDGFVTGESLGQKSSQTSANLKNSSESVSTTVLRPLVTWSKSDIAQKSREIDTYEEAKINSACRSISPDSPATKLGDERLKSLEKELNLQEQVEKAFQSVEKIQF